MTDPARQLAARQLTDLEQVSGGAFEVLARPDADDDHFLVSLGGWCQTRFLDENGHYEE